MMCGDQKFNRALQPRLYRFVPAQVTRPSCNKRSQNAGDNMIMSDVRLFNVRSKTDRCYTRNTRRQN